MARFAAAVDGSSGVLRERKLSLPLKKLGKLLGQTDVEGQVSEIEVTENFLNMQIDKAEEDKKKNQKMYKTLGITIGLIFVIILF